MAVRKSGQTWTYIASVASWIWLPLLLACLVIDAMDKRPVDGQCHVVVRVWACLLVNILATAPAVGLPGSLRCHGCVGSAKLSYGMYVFSGTVDPAGCRRRLVSWRFLGSGLAVCCRHVCADNSRCLVQLARFREALVALERLFSAARKTEALGRAAALYGTRLARRSRGPWRALANRIVAGSNSVAFGQNA